MLLEGYRKEIFRSKCNTQAQSLETLQEYLAGFDLDV